MVLPTTMENGASAEPLALVACMVMRYSPTPLSEPLMIPLAASSFRPSGRWSMLNFIGRSPDTGMR